MNGYFYGWDYLYGWVRLPGNLFGIYGVNNIPIIIPIRNLGRPSIPTRILRRTEPPKETKIPKPSSTTKDRGKDPLGKTGNKSFDTGSTSKIKDKGKDTMSKIGNKSSDTGPTQKGTIGRDGRYQNPTFMKPTFMDPSRPDNSLFGSGFNQGVPSHHKGQPSYIPTPRNTGKQPEDTGPTKKGTIGGDGRHQNPTFSRPSFMDPSQPDNLFGGAGPNQRLIGLGGFGNLQHRALAVHPKDNAHRYGMNGYDGYE